MMIIVGAVMVLSLALWVSVAVRFLGAIFSVRIRTQIAAHPVLHGLWFLAAFLLAAAALWSGQTNRPPGKSDRSRTIATMAFLETACERYQTEYSSFPTGDNAAITKMLQGTNSRNIIFIELKSRDLNAAGETIDPWGTPYRFTLDAGKKPLIQSAGPDRVFDDKDDLSSSSP